MNSYVLVVISSYFLISMVQTLHGIHNATEPPFWNTCDRTPSRIEMVFPGRLVGCWLGQPIGGKDNM